MVKTHDVANGGGGGGGWKETTRVQRLAQWAAQLEFDDLPKDVVERTKDFYLDWIGCVLAGRSHAAVMAMANFARLMGPSSGKSEILSLGATTSAAFAAIVNGASSHVVEQDDLHNSSILHPVRLC